MEQPRQVERFRHRPLPPLPQNFPASFERAKAPETTEPNIETCIVCREEIFGSQIETLPCSHKHCRDCLRTLVIAATKDESLFPAHCCPNKNIAINDYQHFLSTSLVAVYHRKLIEFSCQNRKYCAEPTCSNFILPEDIHGYVAFCKKCSKVTCTKCNTAFHEGICPVDESLQQVLELAAVNHWQRCTRCNGMVSKSTGCNHMICVCGSQWCYICSKPWKGLPSCKCENNYLIRARTDEVTDLNDYQAGNVLAPAAQPPFEFLDPRGRLNDFLPDVEVDNGANVLPTRLRHFMPEVLGGEQQVRDITGDEEVEEELFDYMQEIEREAREAHIQRNRARRDYYPERRHFYLTHTVPMLHGHFPPQEPFHGYLSRAETAESLLPAYPESPTLPPTTITPAERNIHIATVSFEHPRPAPHVPTLPGSRASSFDSLEPSETLGTSADLRKKKRRVKGVGSFLSFGEIGRRRSEDVSGDLKPFGSL